MHMYVQNTEIFKKKTQAETKKVKAIVQYLHNYNMNRCNAVVVVTGL